MTVVHKRGGHHPRPGLAPLAERAILGAMMSPGRVHEHLFDDGRPFASCHASSLVRMADGRFLVAWFAGTRESADDVGIWLAERWQGRWGPPRRVAKVRDLPHWNPVLFLGDEGEVLLWFKVSIPGRRRREGHSVADGWETWTCVSRDAGATWSKPVPMVVEGADRWDLGRGPVKNKPIRLADGTWLAPASTESDTDWEVFVDRSEDGGRTWQATPSLSHDRAAIAGKGIIQPTLWESEPGRVHMLTRSTGGTVCRADSIDGGRTWSPVVPTELPHNNSGLDVARLADGLLVLACNPVTSGRTPLSLLISRDNGHTWPRRLDLESGEGEVSYPAIIPVDGGVAVSYTWRRERIAFCTGSIDGAT